MNLYEIDKELLACIDTETGEIIDEEKLASLEMERDKKVENICLWIKNLRADATAYKAEKDAFYQKQKSAENKAESLKRYLEGYLDGASFKTTRASVSYRKSESVQIDEELVSVPLHYIKTTTTYDKAELKKALKAGEKFDGVELVESNNIQIK